MQGSLGDADVGNIDIPDLFHEQTKESRVAVRVDDDVAPLHHSK